MNLKLNWYKHKLSKMLVALFYLSLQQLTPSIVITHARNLAEGVAPDLNLVEGDGQDQDLAVEDDADALVDHQEGPLEAAHAELLVEPLGEHHAEPAEPAEGLLADLVQIPDFGLDAGEAPALIIADLEEASLTADLEEAGQEAAQDGSDLLAEAV